VTDCRIFNAMPYLMLRWSDDNTGGGVNCWGVVREFYRREFAVDLPQYAISAGNARAVMRESENATELANWERVTDFRFGDVAQLTLASKPQHYAVCVGDDIWLHAQPGVSPVVSTVQQFQDAGYRILSVWRRKRG